MEIETVDDSWLFETDRIYLLKHIKELYTTKFGWADEMLIKSLVKHHYNMTIKEMDKDEYLKERAKVTLGDLLERL